MTTSRISFRTATEGDDDFLVALYGSTREEELALTGWDEARRTAFIRSQFAAQRRHYRIKRPAGREELILVDETAAGRLYCDLSGDTDHLLDLSLLPAYRGRGIGSRVLRGIQERATATGRRVTLYVESFNRSLGLFDRLGFARTAGHGMHCLLEWRPGAEKQHSVLASMSQGG